MLLLTAKFNSLMSIATNFWTFIGILGTKIKMIPVSFLFTHFRMIILFR